MRVVWVATLVALCGSGGALADAAEEVARDEGVFVLTADNFDGFLESHPTALIEFYAPWCGHCKQLAPEYAKAAGALAAAQSAAVLAKVDATVESSLGERFGVQGYPTIKFWSAAAAEPVDYDGGRDADAIVQWVSEKTDPNYKPPPEAVVTLTTGNFREFVDERDLVLVEFYAPWCGHCKRLAPEFEKAAQRLQALPRPIALAKVDATVESELGSEFQVTGYPTLKVLRNGKAFDYNGPRETDGIVEHMIKLALPALKKLSSVKDVQKFMSADDVTVVGYFSSESEPLLKAFQDAGEAKREEFSSMGFSVESAVVSSFKATAPSIVVYLPEKFRSKYEEKERVLSRADASREDVEKFIESNCVPLVGQRTRENAQRRYSKLPLVVAYYTVDFSFNYRDGTQYWRQKVLNVAKDFKDFVFAISDEEEYVKELEEVGLGDSGQDVNVVVFGKDGKKYPWTADVLDDDFAEDTFREFMRKVNSGKARAFVKSQPAPRQDGGAVHTLVGSTFERVVRDETKDVLVELYAPWCGHCKSLEPIYKDMARRLKASQPNLIVAKMDATANDVPDGFDVQGFPTIYLAPSGSKDKPIKYDGGRTADEMIAFIKANAVVSFQKSEL